MNSNNIKQDEGFIAIDKIVKVTFSLYKEVKPYYKLIYEQHCETNVGMLWWRKKKYLGNLVIVEDGYWYGMERAYPEKEFFEKFPEHVLTEDNKILLKEFPKIVISTVDGKTHTLRFDTDEQMRDYLSSLQNRFLKQSIIEI